ncbi:MAG: ricin-type beta-trefoil lectin domain protein [Kineosporiaceae bacterium]
METLARQAIAKGAHPILLTPTSGMSCSGSTAVANRGFGAQVRAAGASTSSPVIDLTTLSVGLYNRLRLCPNDGDYTRGAVGDFFVDRTHFEAAGARQIAGLVAQALTDQRIALADYLRGSSTPPTTTSPSPSVGAPLVHPSGLCLDAEGGVRASGAALVLAACTGTPAQWWMSSSAGDLRTGDQALCVDAYAKGTTVGTKVVLWTCNGGANQQFGRDSGAIRGAQSGLCLAPSGAAVAGAPLVLATCAYDGSQAWGSTLPTVTTTPRPTSTTPTPSSSSPTPTPTVTTSRTKTRTKTKTTKTRTTKSKTTKKKSTRTKTRRAG